MTLRERVQDVRSTGGHMPQSLQHEVLAYVDREARGGRSPGEVLEQLGVSRALYRYWQRKRGKLVPVQFRPVLVREPEAVEGRELVVEVGGVARVRGLRVGDLAELLRALR